MIIYVGSDEGFRAAAQRQGVTAGIFLLARGTQDGGKFYRRVALDGDKLEAVSDITAHALYPESFECNDAPIPARAAQMLPVARTSDH